MRRPWNWTSPLVGSMTPRRTLKNVVLPAPFGPMRLTIESFGDREVDGVDGDEAAEPPGDLAGDEDGPVLQDVGAHRWPSSVVASAVPSSSCSGSVISVWSSRFLRLFGNRPFGPHEHHDHEREAVQQELELDEVDVREDRDLDAIEELVEHLEQDVVDRVDHERADGDTPEVAHAAEDDHREDRERDDEPELVRADGHELGGVEHAGDAGRRGAEREGEELGHDGVDAVRRCRQLVLADGLPRPADPALDQAVAEHHEHRHDGDHREVVRPRVDARRTRR